MNGVTLTLVEKAALRVSLGDVRLLHYPEDSRGAAPTWAVAVRAELDDDRSASNSANYWPTRNARCLCWYSKVNGICSHALAVSMVELFTAPATGVRKAAASSRARVADYEATQIRSRWAARSAEWHELVKAGKSSWTDPVFCAEYRAYNLSQRKAS